MPEDGRASARLPWLTDVAQAGADPRAGGHVARAFSAALQAELREYYRLLAVLEAQVAAQVMAVTEREWLPRPRVLGW